MRGKFKQIFLRVSARGDIDCMSANLKVSRERTLDVIVEDVRAWLFREMIQRLICALCSLDNV